MNIAEVFEEIENALTALEIKDRWGDPCIGLECVGLVHQSNPKKWAKAENDLEAGGITPDEYKKQIFEVIEQFKLDRFRNKLERKLVDLKRDEVEMS